ncbi:UNVERIFIED_CONTAM: hypothetical protein K2H54_061266 [Gekko kuhli]
MDHKAFDGNIGIRLLCHRWPLLSLSGYQCNESIFYASWQKCKRKKGVGELAAGEKVVCIVETASFTDTSGTFTHSTSMCKIQLPESFPSSLTEDQCRWEAACCMVVHAKTGAFQIRIHGTYRD